MAGPDRFLAAMLSHPSPWRVSRVEVGCLLESLSNSQKSRFMHPIGDDLQANRKMPITKAAGDGKRRQPKKIERQGKLSTAIKFLDGCRQRRRGSRHCGSQQRVKVGKNYSQFLDVIFSIGQGAPIIVGGDSGCPPHVRSHDRAEHRLVGNAVVDCVENLIELKQQNVEQRAIIERLLKQWNLDLPKLCPESLQCIQGV